MLFCLTIDVIILLLIVLDLAKLKKKERNKYFNYFEIVLVGIFVVLLVFVFLGGKESEILFWINNNSTFYLIYLLSAIIWTVLNIILYHRK